jgi:8-oxo-dGTP pyrophosphatase MutT (NUDIX family)
MWVTEDVVKTDDGRELTFGVMRKEPYALILPWDGQYITLVGQYRYMVNTYLWELPKGQTASADMREVALQELAEETGLRALDVRHVYDFWIAPGAYHQRCAMFVATKFVQGEQKLEDSERGLVTKKVTLEEFWSMVADGQINDGSTLTAMAIAQNILKLF